MIVLHDVLTEYTIDITDDNDNKPHVEVVGLLPDGASLVNIGNKWGYSFVWDITKPVNISISFVAYDKYNASSTFKPQVCIFVFYFIII